MLKKFLNLGKSMKLKKKPIESIRVRKDRAKKLKDISLELSFEFGDMISEADLVNFLIDTQAENIYLEGDTLKLRDK